MNPSYNDRHELNNSATDKSALLLNERANRFRALAQCSLIEGYTGEEDYGSTSSEDTSDESIASAMSSSDLSVGDENLSSSTDTIMPFGMTYAHQTPQVYMQQAGAPAYESFQRNHTHQSFNFQQIQMMAPFSGYVNMIPRQVQAVPPLINISQPQPLQSPNAVHSIKQQQSPATPQEWTSTPMSITAAHRMADHVSYSQNSYGYINSPLFSSVSCNSTPCFTTSPDVPSVFRLHDQNPDCTFPDGLFCSISPRPVPSVLQSTNKPPVLVSTASSHSPMNLQTTPATIGSVHTLANEIMSN